MQLKNFKCIILSFVFTFALGESLGQSNTEFNNYKKQYPNSYHLDLERQQTIKIKLVKGEIKILRIFDEETMYLSESAIGNTKQSISYSSFFEIKNLEASSFAFEDGKYREYKVKEFKEKNNLNGSFYDDSKSINYIFPKIKKGSKTKVSYEEIVKNPRMLNVFFFGGFSPIKHVKAVVEVDNDINVEFLEFNTENSNIVFTKKEKKNKTIYTWEAHDVDKIEYEYNVPSYKTILPHIVPVINSYTYKGEEKSILDGVKSLYDWYYSLVKDINQDDNDPELITLVNDLIKDKSSDLEKVQAIYYWTQQNIKYIAFEYALGGFIPRESNDVFNKKYGDCKDNSSIMYKMLEIANLEGHLTWIGTRDIPYKYSELPTPMVDNHMILTYFDKDDNPYFLDATGRYTSIDMPPAFIQGKEAMVSFGEDKFKIIEVPILEGSTNMQIDTSYISMKDNSIVGKSTVSSSGYLKSHCYNKLESITKEEKKLAFFNRYFVKGNNKFLISNYDEINTFNYDADYILSFDYEIGDIVKSVSDEKYINLNLNKILAGYKEKEDREYGVNSEYKQVFEYVNIFDVPKGHIVDFLPDNFKIETDFFSSSISYKIENNTIIYTHIVDFNYIQLTIEQQREFNGIIKKIEKEYKEVIVLKKQ